MIQKEAEKAADPKEGGESEKLRDSEAGLRPGCPADRRYNAPGGASNPSPAQYKHI